MWLLSFAAFSITTFLAGLWGCFASIDSSIASDCICLDAAPCLDAHHIKRTRSLSTFLAISDHTYIASEYTQAMQLFVSDMLHCVIEKYYLFVVWHLWWHILFWSEWVTYHQGTLTAGTTYHVSQFLFRNWFWFVMILSMTSEHCLSKTLVEQTGTVSGYTRSARWISPWWHMPFCLG